MSNIKKKKKKMGPDVSFLYKTQFGPLRTISAETTQFLPPRTVSSVDQQLKLKAGMREICFDIGRLRCRTTFTEREGERGTSWWWWWGGGGGEGGQTEAGRQTNKQTSKQRKREDSLNQRGGWKERHRQTGGQRERQRETKTQWGVGGRQTDGESDREEQRHTERQRERQRHTHRQTQRQRLDLEADCR